MRLVIATAFACALLASSRADAQSFQAACKVRTLCPRVERGGGRMMACLREHKDGLSPGCKIAIADFILNRSPRDGADRRDADDDRGPRGRFDREAGRGAEEPGPDERDAPPRRRPGASGSPDGRDAEDRREDDRRDGARDVPPEDMDRPPQR